MTSIITPSTRWRPVTERDPDPNPPRYAEGDPGKPIDFTLTPGERDRAALGMLQLEARRRRLNRRDQK